VGKAKAGKTVLAMLRVLGVAPVDGAALQDALQLPFFDFEDAVTAAAAQRAGCDCIVTRDPKGFRGSPVPAFAPEALIPLI
jgi:predicted nucleic acid-binding protein